MQVTTSPAQGAVLPCNPLPGVKHLVCSNARATTAPVSMLVIESTWRQNKGQADALDTVSSHSMDRKYCMWVWMEAKNCPGIPNTCFSWVRVRVQHTYTRWQSRSEQSLCFVYTLHSRDSQPWLVFLCLSSADWNVLIKHVIRFGRSLL